MSATRRLAAAGGWLVGMAGTLGALRMSGRGVLAARRSPIPTDGRRG